MSSSNLLRIVRNRKSCCNLPCGTFTIGPKYRRHAADLFGPRTNKVPLKSASRAASTSHAFAAARSRLLSPFPSIVSVGYRRHRYDSSTVVTNYYRNFSSEVKANVKMPEATKPFQRLPKNVKPQHYALNLVPDLKSLTFKGDVSVKIEVLESTDEIILNALELNIESVQVKGDKIFIPKEIQVTQSDETVHFKFDTHIAPGVYTLDVVFNGEINNKMRGLYRSKYINEKGEECYAAVTQFESTDARRCFPCWDEPAVKATFDITLVVPKDRVALSNMPVKSQEPDGEDVVKYTFETTPIMSTYLVAAVIGEYDYVEGKSSDGVLVRVYTPKGKKDQGLFALDVATKVLPYYKEYFNIAYPLPKIDLIAIADFMAGAMENWGLVTYRETALLVDPQNTSAVSKQWIALVVGHELAHQWFGNLVTMEWWTHLWLNEGYASFVEFLCVNYLFPEYDIWTQFVNDSYIKALELDSLNNSHPIEVPVGNPSEIDEIFDDISYNKGASVIRMLHHYIGDEDFRKGMHNYLTKHQYKNTFTEDLWEALEDASKKPVGEVMSTWTKQMGFPLVSVTSKRATDGKGVHLTLTQSKFTADGSPAPETYKWMIPISISTSKNPSKEVISTVLKEKQTEIFVPDVTETDWIKVNPGTIGFYRTKYPPEMLEKFVPAIKDKSLPPLDRLGLVDDLFAMVKAGHTNTVEVLKFLRAFEDETDYNVWSSISNILSKLSQLLGCLGPIKEGYDKYQKQLLSKVNERLGWNSNKGETHLDTLLRSLVLGRMALLNDDKTIEEARARLEKHIDGTEVLSADLRSACYKTVLRAGGQKEFETLLKLYRTTDLHEEKDRISRSMGAASELETLKKVLDFAMSDEVRSQDKAFVIIATSLHSIGRELSWEFFKDNWTTIHEQFKGSLMTRLVKYLTENFTSEEKAKEVEAFFQEHSVPGSERTVQQSVESIRLNAKWLSRDEIAIQKYLSSF